MKLKEYILNRTCDFLQEDAERKKYAKLYGNHVDLAWFTFISSGVFYNTDFRNPLLTLTSVLAADVAVRALRGNHGKRAVSGLVGLTRESYEFFKQHL